jgi:lysophospholipase L1-like esterase
LIDRPQVEPSHMSMVKRTVFVALTVVLVCAPIGLAELYLRYVGLGDPILFYANASYRFAPLPNQQKRRLGGASVTIDSRGLRSTHDWSEPADVKILFVGDSVTWGGTYIDDADTFAEGVCQRLARATGKSVVCGNAGANEYGTDNMAERIRYKDFNDETALVVTMIGTDTTRGLVDAQGRFFQTERPPPPFRALWEAAAFLTWRSYRFLRPISYRPTDDLRVAKRSLQNLFGAIRETQRPGRSVLLVLSPSQAELGGHETVLTKNVQEVLEHSGLELLDLHGPVTAALTGDFYYDGTHLDVRGHRFYANQIAARLAPALSRELGMNVEYSLPQSRQRDAVPGSD